MMNIPEELVTAIARGDAVLLVGAGLSMEAGLPGWKDLLEPLADEVDLPPERRTDLPQIAQDYENKFGRQSLLSYISSRTDTTGIPPANDHRLLARLGIRTWVTTNYDNLLEKTLDEAGQLYRRVVRDMDLPYTSADRMTVIKLHGDREQPDTIVITRHDYNTYFRRYPLVKEKLSALMAEKTILFLMSVVHVERVSCHIRSYGGGSGMGSRTRPDSRCIG